MKWIFRIFFAIASLLSVLVCLAEAVLWVRSHYIADKLLWVDSHGVE